MGAVCYLSLGLQGPGLLSGGPSAGLSFPSLFYSLAMLYDSASSEPHKSSLRKEAAGEREKKGSETEGGGKKQGGGHRAQPGLSSQQLRNPPVSSPGAKGKKERKKAREAREGGGLVNPPTEY